MTIRIVIFCSLFAPAISMAALVDHGTFTTDSAQGLDFLDLTASTNRSFNEVSAQFGSGGDFEGWRYATEEQVVTLINNSGFSPALSAGSDATGDTGGDQLSGLVSLLGITNSLATSAFSNGLTGTAVASNQRTVTIEDVLSASENDKAFATDVLMKTTKVNSFGSFLVRTSSLPEPGTLVMFGAFGIVLLARLRRGTRPLRL